MVTVRVSNSVRISSVGQWFYSVVSQHPQWQVNVRIVSNPVSAPKRTEVTVHS